MEGFPKSDHISIGDGIGELEVLSPTKFMNSLEI